MPCEKRATAQIAHLVFADTHANTKKTKRAIFSHRSIEVRMNDEKILSKLLT
jgi:hypothetical protein